MGNNYISSSIVGFTDSTRCQNCWFYSVVDTFNGITLDTFNYSIFNRNAYYLNLDVDTVSLTDGTQGAGKVLTDVTGSGTGTWQDISNRIFTLPTYANEAAAIVGGLTTGKLYKTATGEVRIKL